MMTFNNTFFLDAMAMCVAPYLQWKRRVQTSGGTYLKNILFFHYQGLGQDPFSLSFDPEEFLKKHILRRTNIHNLVQGLGILWNLTVSDMHLKLPSLDHAGRKNITKTDRISDATQYWSGSDT